MPDLVIEAENAKLTRELRQTRQKLGRAVTGLRHYANPKNYDPQGVVTDGSAFGWMHSDRGAYAREILKEIER
jgi:hypothetical protein